MEENNFESSPSYKGLKSDGPEDYDDNGSLSLFNSRSSSPGFDEPKNEAPFKMPQCAVTRSMTKAHKCPSFMNLQGNTGLYHPSAGSRFDYNVVKSLEAMFDDTASDIYEEEKLKTFLRIRPSSKLQMKTVTGNQGVDNDKAINKRSKKKEQQIIEVKDETTVLAYPLQKNVYSFLNGRENRKQTEFKFTKVFGPDAGQSTVFEESVSPIIDKFLKGDNCLIFSYGATNSGKTYTLQGHGTDYGIIPRTLYAIFSRIQDQVYRPLEYKPLLYQEIINFKGKDAEIMLQKKEKLLADTATIKVEPKPEESFACSQSSKSGSSVHIFGASPFDEMNYALFANSNLYSIWVSFAELYNERVYDLLDTVHIGTKRRRKELKLLTDKDGYVYIKDLTEIQVVSEEETFKIFQAGRKHLQFAATQMNQHSSRSHSFFTLRIITLGIGENLMPYPKSVHRMTFCDLAGMERVHQTENEGLRLKESGTINTSLTVLLKVIRILREKQRNGKMMLETIPFRESKLTHIFKSYFTSSTHIRMIVNVNPDPAMAESTLHVLHNSAIASNVITFRPIDDTQKPILKQPQIDKEEKKNGQNKPKNKVKFQGLRSTTSVSSGNDDDESKSSSLSPSNSSENDGNDPPTVLPNSKAVLQKLQELELENSMLRREVSRLKIENDYIREQSVKLLAEQNQLWKNRFAQLHDQEESYSCRRISLMKQKLAYSPGSKCGRDYTPPVVHLPNVAEDEDEYDKENRPPSVN